MTWSELMRENGYRNQNNILDGFFHCRSVWNRGDQGYIQAGFRRVERALRVSYRDDFVLNPQDLAALQGQSGDSRLYEQYWREANAYALEHLKDDELEYYISVTD